MFANPVAVDVAVKQLSAAVDALLAVDLTGASQDELLALARGVEAAAPAPGCGSHVDR